MIILLLAATIAGVPWAAIFSIIGLVLLALAAFLSPQPPYSRFNYGWAGLFFVVLAMAVR